MTSQTRLWLIILGMGIITFGLRISFLLLFGKYAIPPLLQRALRFVPASVLSALILPDLLFPKDHFDLSLHNPRLMAGVIAAFVAWRTKNVLFTILTGMAALWLLQTL